MKWKLLFSTCVLTVSATTHAANAITDDMNHLAIQSSISTGGNLGIAIADYTNKTEIGLTLSAYKNNQGTSFVVPALFAGLRNSIDQQTYFAYGIDLATKFGEHSHEHIRSNIQAGPFISLEHSLTNRLLLVGWIEPYTYEYEKLNNHSVTTQRLFGAGGIGLSYFIT